MHKYLLTATMVITCVLFGAGSMYLIDSAWVYDKVNRYAEALKVSQDMTDNAYDAFYAISMCNTKVGCDFVTTANSLSVLELERKSLKLKLERILEGSSASCSK